MFTGGYAILDLGDNALTAGTAKTIAGTYETLEGNYRKPVLLEGLTIGTTEYNAAFVNVTVSSSKFVFSVYGYNFEIDSDDGVKATAQA